MSDSPPPSDRLLDEFLAAERARPAPPPEDLDRLWRRVSAALPPHDGGGPPAQARPAPRGTSTPSAAARAHLAVVSVASALVGAGLHAGWQRLTDPVTARAPLPPRAPPPRAAPVAPAPTEPAPSPVVTAPPLAAAPPPPPPRSLAATARRAVARDDAHLLERARTALLRGEHGLALLALREHARAHPRGELSEEREALTIQTLLAAGRAAEARERAETFLRAHPESPFRAIVERVLTPTTAP